MVYKNNTAIQSRCYFLITRNDIAISERFPRAEGRQVTGEAANVGIDNTASFIDRSSNSQGEHGSHGLPHEAGGAFFGRRTMSSVLYSSKFGTISVRPSLQIRYRSPEAGGKRVHCARTAVCQP